MWVREMAETTNFYFDARRELPLSDVSWELDVLPAECEGRQAWEDLVDHLADVRGRKVETLLTAARQLNSVRVSHT